MDFMKHVESLEVRLDSLINKAEVWQLVFDEAPIAIAVFDLNLDFFLVNSEFCELTGYSSGELSNRSISLVIPRKFRKMHDKVIEEYIHNPMKKVSRHGLSPEIKLKNGKSKLVYIDLSYFFHDNKPYYVAFIKRV